MQAADSNAAPVLHAGDRESQEQRQGAAKKPGSKELTHMECKNPDGTTYLQILDSESEFEEGSP